MEISKDILDSLKKEIPNSKSLFSLIHVLDLFKDRMQELYPYIINPRETDDLGFWFYNRHDFLHVENVLSYLENITQGITLNSIENYIIYLAAIGHDVGMSPPEIEIREAYKKMFAERKINTTEFWRRMHGSRSGQIIENILEPLVDRVYFTDNLRGTIAQLASSHSQKHTKSQIEIKVGNMSFIVRVGLLCGLLRIADLCDNDKTRIPGPEIVAKILTLSAIEGEPYRTSVNHYLMRYLTREISVESKNSQIVILVTLDNIWKSLKLDLPNEAGQIEGKEIIAKVLEEFSQELGAPQKLGSPDEEEEIRKKTGFGSKVASVRPVSIELLNQERVELQWKVQFVGPESLEKADKIIEWERKAEMYFKDYEEKESVQMIFKPEIIPKATNFVDREKELEKGQNALRRSKGLLIHGIGGVGKTVLAAEITASFSHTKEDVFYYTFHAFSSLSEILNNIAAMLREKGDTTPYEYLINPDAPKFKKILNIIQAIDSHIPVLVFDDIHEFGTLNHENKDNIKDLIGDLFRRSYKTKIILVGRSILEFANEFKDRTVFLRVDGFDKEGCKAYLTKVLKLYPPEIEIMESLYEITRGHPLPLNLASELLKRHPVEKIKELIHEGIRRILISDIYKSLSRDEKRLIGFIAVFQQPVNLSIFEELGINETRTIRVLDSLIDKNLLETREKGIYSLHPLIKEGIYDSLTFRTKKRYHLWAFEHFYASKNYSKALEHAIKSKEIKTIHATYDKSIEQMKTLGLYRYIEMLLKSVMSLKIDLHLRGKCLKDIAFCHVRTGRTATAYELYKESLNFISNSNTEKLVEIYRYLADIEHILDRYPEAMDLANIGVKAASRLPPNDPTRVYMESQKGHIEVHLHPIKSLDTFRQIVPIARHLELSNVRVTSDILYMYGDALIVCEYYEKALPVLEEALHYARLGKYVRGEANVLRRKADISLRMGSLDEALEDCKKSETIYLRIGDRSYVYLLRIKGEISKMQGKYAESKRYYEEAKDLSEKAKKGQPNGHVIFGLLELSRLRGDFMKAYYDKLCKAYKDTYNIWGVVNVNIAASLGSLAQDEMGAFEFYLAEAERLIKEHKGNWRLPVEEQLVNQIKQGADPCKKYPLIFP